jgi:hypothetical protein
MDFGSNLSESFEYAKEAVFGKWVKWILLIIPFMMPGYTFQIFKGAKPAPEINDWVANFINGIKMAIVVFIYMIPVLIIGAIFLMPLIFAAISQDGNALMAGIGSAMIGLLICVVLTIIIAIILPIALIRFARTESFGQAFKFGEIFAKIGQIGWGTYIISWIVLMIAMVVFSIIMGIIGIIPLLGWIIDLFIEVMVGIFCARYWILIFDNS